MPEWLPVGRQCGHYRQVGVAVDAGRGRDTRSTRAGVVIDAGRGHACG